jgi:2OG-Fe(II) oxygenase superfamily
MRLNLERHRREYSLEGATVVTGIFPPRLIEHWRRWALAHARRVGLVVDGVACDDWTYQRPGDRHNYVMVPGRAVEEHLPEMLHWYQALIPTVSAVTFQDVVPSPYEDSRVNVLVYDRPGSAIGWHRDTNLITFFLYLSDNVGGGTLCRLLPRRPGGRRRAHTFPPRAGAVLLMQGRWVPHRGLPVGEEVKVVAPWNYYSAEDQWRPDGFDDRIYGRGDSARA